MTAARLLGLAAALTGSLVLPGTAAAHYPATIDVGVGAGGTATMTSPTVPKDAKKVAVTVSPTAADDDEFAFLAFGLSMEPSRKVRSLICLMLALNLIPRDQSPVDFEIDDPVLAILFLRACLQIASTINPAGPRAAAAANSAAAACGRLPTRVGAKITRSGGRFRLHAAGTPGKAGKRGTLIVSCKRKGRGMKFVVRPRKRGTTLRKVIGPRLSFGIANNSPNTGTTTRVRATFGLK